MIYINNELYKPSTAEDREEDSKFNAIFAEYMNGLGKFIKPVTIKYIPSLIKNDPHNPGKLIMPRSKQLSFVVQTMHKVTSSREPIFQQCEIRYSSTPPRVNPKTGEPTFSNTSISIFDGVLSTHDRDLIYFFWRWSEQNAGDIDNAGNIKAWFVIEDTNAEINELAEQKRLAYQTKSRLWNEAGDGGLTDAEIIVAAKNLMIPGVDSIENINEVRLRIETLLEVDKESKSLFLSQTDRKTHERGENIERRYLVQSALDLMIIGQDHMTMSFYLLNEKGKQEGQPLMKYTKKEKDPKMALFMQLEGTNSELLDVIKQRVDAKREQSAVA